MWLNLQIFGFRAMWSPYFMLFVISLAVLYFLFTGPLRHKFGDVIKPTRAQKVFFYIGLILLYAVKGAPVDLLSHIIMSAHMIQMAILYLLFPIFIIRGLPVWVLEKFIALPVINKVFKVVTKPLIALAMFSSLFTIYHIPLIFDYSKSSQVAHVSITLILLVTAFIMWWPIVTPIVKLSLENPLLKMAYLLGNILMVSIACALIIFATKPMYMAYSSDGAWLQSLSLCVPGDVLSGISGSLTGADMFSPLSAKDDQQLGGIIMMFMQQIIFGFVIAWVFFGWFSKKNLAIDPMPDNLPHWNQEAKS